MALIKRIQKFGNTRGLLLSGEIRDLLGVDEGSEVVMEVVGETLLVRRADAPRPDPLQILAGMHTLTTSIRRVDGKDLTESRQWFFVMIRAFQPKTATALAQLLGKNKQYVTRLVREAEAAGEIVWTEDGMELAGGVFET